MTQLTQIERDGLEDVFAVLNIEEKGFFNQIISLIKKYINIF